MVLAGQCVLLIAMQSPLFDLTCSDSRAKITSAKQSGLASEEVSVAPPLVTLAISVVALPPMSYSLGASPPAPSIILCSSF